MFVSEGLSGMGAPRTKAACAIVTGSLGGKWGVAQAVNLSGEEKMELQDVGGLHLVVLLL